MVIVASENWYVVVVKAQADTCAKSTLVEGASSRLQLGLTLITISSKKKTASKETVLIYFISILFTEVQHFLQ